MGYAKDKWMEEQEGGYSSPIDKYVCPDCVTDDYLADALTAELEQFSCSYCGAEEAADISVLLGEISEVFTAEYTDPVNELPYETKEGGYQGEVFDGSDLVFGLDSWTECNDLLDDAVQAFAQSSWCKRNYFGTDEYEELSYGWSNFTQQVKHHTRFLFFQKIDDSDGVDQSKIPPGRMLATLGKLFRRYKLFIELPVGTEFVRARVVKEGERPTSVDELGTAPHDAAIFPNRMSPSGIPMFYAAFDESTAVLETYEPEAGGEREIALARFKNLRPLKLLDLTSLPEMPSNFDRENREKRHPIAFLRSFEGDFTRPVERDGRAHTEYVPTQVVTEYVRHRLRAHLDAKLDGVLYKSSRHGASTAVVIFADPEDCGPRGPQFLGREPFLELVDVSYKKPDEFESFWKDS